MPKIFRSEILFLFLVSAVILSLNLTPLLLQAHHSPPGRTFGLIHNNVQDFFFYQSLMNEGASGQWLTTDPYTSETHQPSIIFSYFLLIGRLSNLLNLPYPYTYHILRILLSICLLSAAFFLINLLKIPHPRLTFFFFIFADSFMHTIKENGVLKNVAYMDWWTGMDNIRRAAYLPHHLFGGLFLVITLILIIRYVKNQKRKYIISSVLFAGLLAFIHTPSLFIILLILPPTVCFHYLFNRNIKLSVFLALSVYWLAGLFFLLFMVSQTNNGFPWSQYIDWEKNLQFPLNKELIGALGILVPFSLIGIIKSFKSKRFELILVACWFFVPFLLIPFSKTLGFSNIRLIQGLPYLPLSILSVIGINFIAEFIKSLKVFKSDLNNIKINQAVYGITVLLFIVFSLPSLSWSLNDQIREFWPIFGNVYFDNRLSSGFNYINAHFPPKTVTLSTFYTGNYLPAFTHVISFIGHTGYTYNLNGKQTLVNKFFANQMTGEEAANFLIANKVKLIFQGPEEKPLYKNYLYPGVIKPVYDKEELTLYIPNF